MCIRDSNYAAVDPVLTNAKCSFWHFRWDANSDIKMTALTNYMKTRPNIKKVYLINQVTSTEASNHLRVQPAASPGSERLIIESLRFKEAPQLQRIIFARFNS